MEDFIIYLQHDVVLEYVAVKEISTYFKNITVWHDADEESNTISVSSQKIKLSDMEHFNRIVSLFIDCSNVQLMLEYVDYGYYQLMEKTL